MKPKISVIVPIYNSAKNLRQCIDSILEQTEENIEIILVDDGSIDESPQIVDAYLDVDDRIKVVHQSNQGAMASRMQGVNCASGKWISFIDADDWIDFDYYEKMLAVVDRDESVDIVVSGVAIEGVANRVATNFSDDEEAYLDCESALVRILNRNGLTWSIVDRIFKKSLFDNFDQGERFDNGEDFITTIKIYKRVKNIVHIRANGYHYRLDMASISHEGKRNDFADVQLEAIRYLDGYDEKIIELIVGFAEKNIVNKLYELWFDDHRNNANTIVSYQQELKRIVNCWGNLICNDAAKVWLLNEDDRDKELKRSVLAMTQTLMSYQALCSKVYVFGTGVLASRISNFLSDFDVDGYVVTNKDHSIEWFKNKKVFSIEDLLHEQEKNRDVKTLIILGVNEQFAINIESELTKKGFICFWPWACQVHMY